MNGFSGNIKLFPFFSVELPFGGNKAGRFVVIRETYSNLRPVPV
jgi:hypothetical protein